MDEKKDGSTKLVEALMGAWDKRPWKDYAQNPPSMAPQIGLALGLLHPRLGGATRDLGMARGGSTPSMAQMPADMPGMAQPQGQGFFMGGNRMRAQAGNANKPLSNVERYEAYLNRMYEQGAQPVPFNWFMRGIE